MKKILKVVLLFFALTCVAVPLSACKESNQNQSVKKIKIEDVSYSSLSEAVENAKSGDTVYIYSDITDNKNVEINKPLTIIGVKNQNNTKPKFYGSLTINTSGKNDLVTIKDLDIIHKGTEENNSGNDTRIGINLIDGGLELNSSNVSLYEPNQADLGASGIVISRKAGSVSEMPISLKNNIFGDYELGNLLSGAMIIKKNKENIFENLNLNAENLFKQNSFSFAKEGNQFVSISYNITPEKVDYLVTSSSKELLDKLLNNQPENSAVYILKNAQDAMEKSEAGCSGPLHSGIVGKQKRRWNCPGDHRGKTGKKQWPADELSGQAICRAGAVRRYSAGKQKRLV